jgi:hypothetical protein
MCRYLLLLHIIIQNVGEFEKTGNDIFRNVNLVLNICQLIVYSTVLCRPKNFGRHCLSFQKKKMGVKVVLPNSQFK